MAGLFLPEDTQASPILVLASPKDKSFIEEPSKIHTLTTTHLYTTQTILKIIHPRRVLPNWLKKKNHWAIYMETDIETVLIFQLNSQVLFHAKNYCSK